MYGTTGHTQYRAQAVETASPAKLVLMLYDGALSALTQAEQALSSSVPGRLETANSELQRAQRIVEELLVSLDADRGGAIAVNLASLYRFCLERLEQANVTKDAAGLPAVRDVLAGLREAWEAACCLTPVGA